ncbi:MAG: histidine kinase [Gemmatimonadaceae bacterium]|nr:histidine kinase [Chitinophagaceae bacterium]
MSILKRVPTYWLYQLFGWGMFILTNTFFAYTYDRFDEMFGYRLLVYLGLGFFLSHVMRSVIHWSNILIKPVKQQIFGFIFITILFAIIVGVSEAFLLQYFDLLRTAPKGWNDLTKLTLTFAFDSFVYLFIWNCIYYIYHYIEKNRRQQVDTLKLEALVKELELKTIKSHINPHFIFNALNSVRALIDENPGRARTAITELSNILRSSMQAEKSETVPFERELNIVKDYLALEHIRFEDRLKIEYEVDEDTLDQPVPPMMLQTLVENAIKHGISKQVSGGTVKIISDFKDNHHELVVQNTGYLNGAYNADGFGLTSTQNRLQLLFGEKANFSIREINGNMVEAKVELPVLLAV